MSEQIPNNENKAELPAGIRAAGVAAALAVGALGATAAYEQVGLYQIENDPAHASAHEVPGSVRVASLTPEGRTKMLALMSAIKLTRVPTSTELDIYDKYYGTEIWDVFVPVMKDRPLLIDEAYAIGKKLDSNFSVLK